MDKAKKLFLISGLILFFAFAGSVQAGDYSFMPSPVDMYDLDHTKYYTWGINWSIPTGESLVSASLFFDNIRNWDNNANDLYVHLLDSAASGLTVGTDNQGGGDNFAGQGILLNHWKNLPSTPQDITYTFDAFELSTLILYLSDGNFGFGIDPDCHFYNDGIKFTVNTRPIPEPATMLLLGTGLIGLGVLGRKKLRKL